MTYAVEYRDMHDARHYLAICESWHHAQATLEAIEGDLPHTASECVAIDHRIYPRRYKGAPVILANRVGTRIKTDTSFRDVKVEYDIIPDYYGGNI